MKRVRSRSAFVLPAAACVLSLGGVGCSAPPEETLAATARSVFGVIDAPPAEALAGPEVELGRSLFWDERISLDGRTSCGSCHTREAWGADRRRHSTDAHGRLTGRHSQTVFNAAHQPVLRWLGDRRSAADQAEGSLSGSMGLPEREAVVPLLLEHGYEAAFRSAFPEDPEPVSPSNYGRALEAYQRTLVTPAPFDAYLAGDRNALTPEQREGLEQFIATGCAGCHSGPLLGGQLFQRFGITQDYWTATGSEQIDEGRFAITGEEGDRYVFRTPMLRNVARTGPFFHDGSVAELSDAVRVMAAVQLGRELADSDVERIVAFLDSLSGEVPDHYAPPLSRGSLPAPPPR